MIIFKEIKVLNGYIYALVTDLESNKVSKVKISLTKEEYNFDTEYTGDMIKALWVLKREINKCNKCPEEYTVYWG